MMSKTKTHQDFVEDEQLKEVIQDILHPYLSKKDPIITIQFGVPRDKEEEWKAAVGFASAYNTYRKSKIGRMTKHRVDFHTHQAWDVYQLYQMVENSPHLEIFIDGLRLPYAATLWLPLLWFYLP